ncbi:MAG: FHA domain-containing protein [Pirellulaceae bacterium]|jgi:predicted component of type VI protein secretion system|nr:FHA domain-containing protein [Pirellulaceae bacterium]MDP7020611.1 FHA domain-containing protein [Pirellulaceae bacterium]
MDEKKSSPSDAGLPSLQGVGVLVMLCEDEWMGVFRLTPDASPITLGRSGENDIELAWDRCCSRSHAQFEWDNGEWRIVDLESRNGLRVNDEKISGSTTLNHKDRVRIGKTRFIFTDATRESYEVVPHKQPAPSVPPNEMTRLDLADDLP